MRLSIVTPSFNQGSFIGKTIESILNQKDGLDIELIIVDGQSTDNTRAVVEQYRPRIKQKGISFTFISEPDAGQSDAINKGSKIATGQLLTYLNSDDYYEPMVLDRVIQFFSDQSEARWGYGGWKFVDAQEKVYLASQPPKFNRRKLYNVCYIVQPSCFYRRQFFIDLGLLNTSLQYGMDYDLWLRMVVHSSPVVIPIIISNARYHMQAKSSTSTRKQLIETWKLQTQYSHGWVVRLGQLFYFIRGWIVVILGLDISRRIEKRWE